MSEPLGRKMYASSTWVSNPAPRIYQEPYGERQQELVVFIESDFEIAMREAIVIFRRAKQNLDTFDDIWPELKRRLIGE